MLFSVLFIYLILSSITRIVFLIWSIRNVELSVIPIVRAFFTGFLFDLTTGLLFLSVYAVYLVLVSRKYIGCWLDKAFTYLLVFVVLFIFYFSLMAEFPFWDEFGVRFNFIAVDYLIYTYEVIANINQSYPLPLIFATLILLLFLTYKLLDKAGVFNAVFSDRPAIKTRLAYLAPVLLVTSCLLIVLKNSQADFSNNLTINELGKNGSFSFFAAFKSNELDYDLFYPKLKDPEAYAIVRKSMVQENQHFLSTQPEDINRVTKGGEETHPNIILITIESFSASFMKSFGNENNITPFFDSLSKTGVFFSNLYATGTRTVRGMEALVLSVPPTPGNSIVRRPNNQHIFSIATVLKHKNYHPYFIYGGDGYFDNMNAFFSGQGFDIVDRNNGRFLSDALETNRYAIASEEVSFENAWGACDEDIYKQSIKYADKSQEEGVPFFQFIMTTSNHKPYTFPVGKIDLPQGERNAAVKYTDYALRRFIETSKEKRWFQNTVFVIVADHCASSAGKWEINIDKHHIPALFYNLPTKPVEIKRLVSQIDLMPTLFGYLNWSYETELYGKDINQTKPGEERAFIGNYRTLGLLQNDIFTQIDDRKKIKQFAVMDGNRKLTKASTDNNALVAQTIAYYQTASQRFKKGKMRHE